MVYELGEPDENVLGTGDRVTLGCEANWSETVVAILRPDQAGNSTLHHDREIGPGHPITRAAKVVLGEPRMCARVLPRPILFLDSRRAHMGLKQPPVRSHPVGERIERAINRSAECPIRGLDLSDAPSPHPDLISGPCCSQFGRGNTRSIQPLNAEIKCSVTQPGLVHPAINSFPNVSREVPVKGCAHTSIEDRVPEPPRNLVEVKPSRASGSVTSEVARSRACQIVLLFGTYNVFHFSGHHFKICPGSRLEALVLAWPTAARRSHQTAALC